MLFLPKKNGFSNGWQVIIEKTIFEGLSDVIKRCVNFISVPLRGVGGRAKKWFPITRNERNQVMLERGRQLLLSKAYDTTVNGFVYCGCNVYFEYFQYSFRN